MPLIAASMEAGFLSLSRNKPQDRPTVARKWAEIYDSYAQAALTANGGKFLFTGSEKSKLEGLLLPAVMLPMGVPATLAAAWVAGLTAYWGGPPVTTTPAPIPVAPFTVPGISAPPIGAPALLAGLTALYLTPSSTESVFAQSHAQLLDACTRTVLVTFAPGGAFPIV